MRWRTWIICDLCKFQYSKIKNHHRVDDCNSLGVKLHTGHHSLSLAATKSLIREPCTGCLLRAEAAVWKCHKIQYSFCIFNSDCQLWKHPSSLINNSREKQQYLCVPTKLPLVWQFCTWPAINFNIKYHITPETNCLLFTHTKSSTKLLTKTIYLLDAKRDVLLFTYSAITIKMVSKVYHVMWHFPHCPRQGGGSRGSTSSPSTTSCPAS